MFKTPKQREPKPTPLPTEDDASIQSRRDAALRELRGRRGYRATLLKGDGALGDQKASGYRPLLS